MHLLGPVRDSVDDGRGTLLELAGDAVDSFIQQVVNSIGEIDELVVNVAGLEIEAARQALAGIEHGARGFRAGLFKPIKQVAAAFSERENHVVAGVAERTGNML